MPRRAVSRQLSKQPGEGGYAEVSGLEDTCECRSLHWAMSRHRDFEEVASVALLKADVAATLTYNNPAVTLERCDDLMVRKRRNDRQTTSSFTSTLSPSMESSSTSSR